MSERETPQEVQHRLAAVVFADIVGFSDLASSNEGEALQLVQILQSVAKATARRHKGRVVKFTGDGALSEFSSTDAAVRASIILREDFVRSAASCSSSPRDLRLGVHVGDVASLADGDIYGDGVNLAARIQQKADPGQVLVSEDVWRQLRQRKEFRFHPAGNFVLKGMRDRVRGFNVSIAGKTAMEPGDFAVAPRPRPPRRFRRTGIVVALIAGLVCVVAIGSWYIAQPAEDTLAGSTAAPRATSMHEGIEELVARISPAVVLISALSPKGVAEGSGFLIDSGGIIVTNYHVIEGARSARVKLASGQVFDEVGILSTDPARDLAILKVSGRQLPFVELGDSDSVRIGSEVIAIGNSLGLEDSVSTGIVSGRIDIDGQVFLQISAPISSGSSGGPVLNASGETIGVVAREFIGGQNLNFVIPVNHLRRMSYGRVAFLDEYTDEPLALAANNGRIAFVSHRDGNSEIYVMNSDGTGQTLLTNNRAFDSEPAWSPDGTKIAFVSSRDAHNYREIYVMNADGTTPTRLTNNRVLDSEPAWSPDGTKIAFRSSRDGGHDIYVMNADGTGPTRLTNSSGVDGEPAWSPDGTKIAFVSYRDSSLGEIYVMNADGTGQTRLTSSSTIDDSPAWSPDGTKIAFMSSRDGGYDIYVMNADGMGQTNLTSTPRGFDLHPAWSPDATKIAFTTDRDGSYEIYVMNADGTAPTRLTNSLGKSEFLAWGP